MRSEADIMKGGDPSGSSPVSSYISPETGKKRIYKGEMIVVSFKADLALVQIIEDIARKKRVSKSQLIRMAIRKYIADYYETNKPYITRRVKVW